MSSRAKVEKCIRRARSESAIDAKLNAVADAINEFVAYVEQIEHLMRPRRDAIAPHGAGIIWSWDNLELG